MPAAFAGGARVSPARLVRSGFGSERRSGWTQFTVARVWPDASSISCADRPRFERNTETRGRCAVPETLARTRLRRFRRRSPFVRMVMLGPPSSCALSDLALDVLALVANALALVGLGRALLADDRRGLADQLLGDAFYDNARRLGDLELDPIRCDDGNRVRVADGELQVPALQLGAIPDALDLQPLLITGGDALHHVRDERAGQSVQRAMFAAVRWSCDEQLL